MDPTRVTILRDQLARGPRKGTPWPDLGITWGEAEQLVAAGGAYWRNPRNPRRLLPYTTTITTAVDTSDGGQPLQFVQGRLSD